MHEAFAAYERVRHRLPPVQRSAACKQMPNLEAIADEIDGVPERVARHLCTQAL